MAYKAVWPLLAVFATLRPPNSLSACLYVLLSLYTRFYFLTGGWTQNSTWIVKIIKKSFCWNSIWNQCFQMLTEYVWTFLWCYLKAEHVFILMETTTVHGLVKCWCWCCSCFHQEVDESPALYVKNMMNNIVHPLQIQIDLCVALYIIPLILQCYLWDVVWSKMCIYHLLWDIWPDVGIDYRT